MTKCSSGVDLICDVESSDQMNRLICGISILATWLCYARNC